MVVDFKNMDTIVRKLEPFRKRFGYDLRYEWDKITYKYMDKCDRILDIGCGPGRFIEFSPKKIIGLDNNPEAVEICKRKGFTARLGQAIKLPFEDESFDGVHCAHLIEHLYPEDAYRLLKEMNRVLKNGGIICIMTPLLHSGFYYALTHIKPYYPEAILHYLKTMEQDSTSLETIPCLYKIVKLKYRRAQLFERLTAETRLWFLYPIFNVLYRLGIRSFKRTGYVLVLRKIK